MPRPSGRPSALVYGSVPWDTPWLTEHNLARSLGRTHDVLYVNPPSSPLTPMRHGLGRRTAADLKDLLTRRLADRDGQWVLTPLALPPLTHPRARRWSGPLLRRQVEQALDLLGLTPEVLVTARAVPEGLPARGTPKVAALVKDWVQAGGHLTGNDMETVRRLELELWHRADLVCATSQRLVDRLRAEGIEAVLLRHGANADHAPAGSAAVVPAALAALPRPLLGCAGRIDPRWDFAALRALADAHPEGTVVLIGPVSPRLPPAALDALLARPNVHRFPAVAGAELPAWLAALDCCLIPYIDDEWQHFASPLKVWDYLLTGVPIAATGSPALGEFPDGLVAFALESRRLPEAVAAALARGRPEDREARRAFALANTWDRRAEELVGLLRAVPGRA